MGWLLPENPESLIMPGYAQSSANLAVVELIYCQTVQPFVHVITYLKADICSAIAEGSTSLGALKNVPKQLLHVVDVHH